MEYNKSHLLDVLRVFFKWKRPILIFTGAAAIISVVASLLLPNYYQAETIFYAASPDLQSPATIFGDSNKDLEFFGEGEDRDRLLQAANSNDLFNYMVQTFHLYQHYDIDSTQLKAPYKMRKRFAKHFKVIKNERDAIVLSVEDKDRELAAKMANTARDKVNEIGNKLLRGSQKQIIESFRQQIEQKEKILKNIADSMAVYRTKYGIFDAKYQSKVIAELTPKLNANLAREKVFLKMFQQQGIRDSIRVYKTKIAATEQQIKSLSNETKGSSFSTGISKLKQLEAVERTMSQELAEERVKYEKYKAAFLVPKPALFVQDIAEVPVVKSRPKRSFIVLGVTFLAFLISLLGVFVLEYNKDVDWKSIKNTK